MLNLKWLHINEKVLIDKDALLITKGCFDEWIITAMKEMYYREFDLLLELLLTANMKHDTVFQNEDNLWDRLYKNYMILL